MSALAIIVTEPDRIDAALRLAAAAAALSRPVAMLFDGSAVTSLRHGVAPELLTDAMALGVRVTACQTGLAAAGMQADALASGVDTGGMVGFLAEQAGAQVVLA
ncbi:peroxiredoxin [Polymorphobacter arshaanensis]|uniref:Peroxiredoxin n=1 Tax=Glacieibacterium arshaanense TaxID=2511025 RepID=A0A4Y9ELJ9_9SPHN|nr:DsrE family protein [Polymorphobacter arshaanensis]TFU02907.1 peroxiredoxin [Polymorphobacter arshaanensis]